MNFANIDELLEYTEKIKGKTFGEMDTKNALKNGLRRKGVLGDIVETGFYGYKNNNNAEADFYELGIELKVSGYIRNKNGTISAKERLVLGMINYNEIVKDDFEFSKLFLKNKKILIIWYEYDKEKSPENFVITDFQLYDLSGDELIIKNDYNIIRHKVIEGEAHLLSEGDTSYLGACTKAATSKNRTKQPFSSIDAKPRAFSFKNAYLTGLLRSSGLCLEVDDFEYKTIEEYVFSQIQNFIGKTQLEIYENLFGETCDKAIPKHINKIISNEIIGKDKELKQKHDLFRKTNYKIKNLPVSSIDYPLERMAFRNICLSEFEEDWDSSEWKKYFEEVTLVVLCYEGSTKIKNGFRVLKEIKKISFSDEDIQLFKRSYDMVKKAIEKKDISLLPYPKSFSGQPLVVAPKGLKNDDAYNNFFKKDVTKVCFMISKDFLFEKLQN